MNLVSVLLRSNVIAKPQDLSLTRHISDVRRNAQPLRQPVGLAELLRLRHCLGKDVAHRDIAAFNDQLPNKLSPHARATTGDDRDSARELLHRRPPSDGAHCVASSSWDDHFELRTHHRGRHVQPYYRVNLQRKAPSTTVRPTTLSAYATCIPVHHFSPPEILRFIGQLPADLFDLSLAIPVRQIRHAAE